MIIASLLILTLFFTGYWIYDYARLGAPPWGIVTWFGYAALVVIVAGIFFVRRGRTRREP
ncbi:MAG: hypothetical protein FJ144_05655 [Deltaproteobacteria bacterium]|nr:hypothetical protein [Deltaproteobacteria bacterium]